MEFTERLQHAWNAFMNKDPTNAYSSGQSYSRSPNRIHLSRGNERSIVTAVYNRLALDTAAIGFKHIRLDKNNRF